MPTFSGNNVVDSSSLYQVRKQSKALGSVHSTKPVLIDNTYE